MPAGRPNVIDSHDSKLLIVKALLLNQSNAKISRDFGVSIDALARYRKNELRRYMVNGNNILQAEQAIVRAEQDGAVRDLVMQDITEIRGSGHKLLKALIDGMPGNGELDCDPKAAAAIMREIRGNAELQARLEGRLDAPGAVHVNVNIGLASAAPVVEQAEWPDGETIDAEPVR